MQLEKSSQAVSVSCLREQINWGGGENLHSQVCVSCCGGVRLTIAERVQVLACVCVCVGGVKGGENGNHSEAAVMNSCHINIYKDSKGAE